MLVKGGIKLILLHIISWHVMTFHASSTNENGNKTAPNCLKCNKGLSCKRLTPCFYWWR